MPGLLDGAEQKYLYSQARANAHLRMAKMASKQRPRVNNGHYFLVPRVAIVHKFDCNLLRDFLPLTGIIFLKKMWTSFIVIFSFAI